jgi:hypothetical protein
MLQHSPKNKFRKLSKRVADVHVILKQSKQTTDTLSNETNNRIKHEICLFSESPHYIVRVRSTHICLSY